MRFLKIMAWIVGIPVAILLLMMAYGAYLSATDWQPSPKSNAREAISQCWSNQGKKSNSPGEAQFIAGACEKMEDNFRKEYKANP